MNILHLRSEYLDNGPGTQPLKIALEFKSRGCKSFFSGAKGYMEDNIRKAGFDFFEISELSRTNRNPLSFFISLYKIRKIVKKYEIDVIHSHNAACSFVGYFSTLLLGKKIAIVRSVRGVELRPTHQYRNWIYKIYPAKLLAVCEFAKQTLLDFGVKEKNIIVTYNGADLVRFNKNTLSYSEMRKVHAISDNEVLIGHVGAFSGWKGQEVLVKALCRLESLTSKKVKLMFVGDGKAYDEVRALVTKLGLDDKVIFVGRTFDSEKYHMAFDIYCQPSTQGELFPNAIVEALALGKPWVGSKISGLPELTNNGKAGVVVEPNDAEALANALLPFVENEELRRKTGLMAYKFVLDKLTISKVCDRIYSGYTRS
jgi:glycosyltransferase involved in cell wall biosynthesis